MKDESRDVSNSPNQDVGYLKRLKDWIFAKLGSPKAIEALNSAEKKVTYEPFRVEMMDDDKP
jgi:hypothetical protein